MITCPIARQPNSPEVAGDLARFPGNPGQILLVFPEKPGITAAIPLIFMNKNPICSPQTPMNNPIITNLNPNHTHPLLFQIPHHTTPDIMSLSPTIRHHRPPTMSPSLTTQHHQPLTMSPNPIIQAHTMNPNPTTHRLLITNPNLTIPHPLTMNQNPIIPNPNLTIPHQLTMNPNPITPNPTILLLTLDTMNQNPTIHPVQTMGHLHLAQIMAHQNRTNLKVQSCLNIDHTNQKKSNQLPSQHTKLIPDLIVGKFRIRIAIMLIQKLDVL